MKKKLFAIVCATLCLGVMLCACDTAAISMPQGGASAAISGNQNNPNNADDPNTDPNATEDPVVDTDTTEDAVIDTNTTEDTVIDTDTPEDTVIDTDTTEDAVIDTDTPEDAVIDTNTTEDAVIDTDTTEDTVIDTDTTIPGGTGACAPKPVSAPFQNDTNYMNAPIGQVSIQPKYVYWEDDMLIAVCFVCNGTQNTVYNIDVEELSFKGNDGALASATFGVCNGLSLAPMTYEEWTFRFPADCISQFGADLSYLSTHSSVGFYY